MLGGATLHIKGTLNHAGTGALRVGGGAVLSVDVGATLNLQGDADIGFQGSPATLSVAGTTTGRLRERAFPALSFRSRIPVRSKCNAVHLALPAAFPKSWALRSWAESGPPPARRLTMPFSSWGSNIATIGLAAAVTLNGPNSSSELQCTLYLGRGSLSLSGGEAFPTPAHSPTAAKFSRTTSVVNVAGKYTQTATGTATYTGSGTSIGRIRAGNNVQLAGKLTVSWTGALPAIGSVSTIVENLSANAVVGTFQGLRKCPVHRQRHDLPHQLHRRNWQRCSPHSHRISKSGARLDSLEPMLLAWLQTRFATACNVNFTTEGLLMRASALKLRE